MTSAALLIVDVQKGFLNDWTGHIPAQVEALQNRYEKVFVTRFSNPEGSNYRKLIGWRPFAPGTRDTELAFTPRDDAVIIDKVVYSCVTGGFLARLKGIGIDTVHLSGIATDNCVLKCAVDLFEAGLRPIVLADFCASHGGPECHDCGLRLLRRFIGEQQVVSGTTPRASAGA